MLNGLGWPHTVIRLPQPPQYLEYRAAPHSQLLGFADVGFLAGRGAPWGFCCLVFSLILDVYVTPLSQTTLEERTKCMTVRTTLILEEIRPHT